MYVSVEQGSNLLYLVYYGQPDSCMLHGNEYDLKSCDKKVYK